VPIKPVPITRPISTISLVVLFALITACFSIHGHLSDIFIPLLDTGVAKALLAITILPNDDKECLLVSFPLGLLFAAEIAASFNLSK
jgi:hypothetical protein